MDATEDTGWLGLLFEGVFDPSPVWEGFVELGSFADADFDPVSTLGGAFDPPETIESI